MTSFIDEFMCSLPAWRAEKIGEVNLEKALEVLESNVDGYYMDAFSSDAVCASASSAAASFSCAVSSAWASSVFSWA